MIGLLLGALNLIGAGTQKFINFSEDERRKQDCVFPDGITYIDHRGARRFISNNHVCMEVTTEWINGESKSCYKLYDMDSRYCVLDLGKKQIEDTRQKNIEFAKKYGYTTYVDPSWGFDSEYTYKILSKEDKWKALPRYIDLETRDTYVINYVDCQRVKFDYYFGDPKCRGKWYVRIKDGKFIRRADTCEFKDFFLETDELGEYQKELNKHLVGDPLFDYKARDCHVSHNINHRYVENYKQDEHPKQYYKGRRV